MESELKNKIFEKYYIKCDKADSICNELGIKRTDFTKLTTEIDKDKATELVEMRRIRQLYNNKKGADFKFNDFKEFYDWYLKQYDKQNGCCYYCKSDEKIISTLFEKKYTNIKRTTRGKHLEVERRDSNVNEYNSKNCVLACYFCNNDKSDIFSEEEYFEYLKDRKSFFINQFNSLK